MTSRSRPSGSSLAADGRGIYPLLRPHLRPELPRLVAGLLLGLVIAALSAAQPLLTRLLIDDGLIGRRLESIVMACVAMLLVAAGGSALGALHRYVYVGASGRVLFSLRTAVYAHLQRVSPRRLSQIPTGDLVTRLDGDVAEVQRFGTDSMAALLGSLLSLLVVGVVMVRLSWQLTLVVVALLPLQLVIRHYARPRIERSTRRVREGAAGISAFLIETLSAARTVQASGAERHETDRLAGLGRDYLGRVVHAQLVGYATGTAATLLGNLSTAAVFLLGGWYVLDGQLTVGTLVAFAAYLGRSAGSATAILGLYTGYQRARVSLARVGDLLALPTVAETPDARLIDESAPGDLELRAVTVRLPRESRNVLDAVSVRIPPGTKLVLGGASGVGKSTLADVLRRFVDPDEGVVLLDGRPLNEYRLADLRRRVAVVDHSPLLLKGSLLDNLRYGNRECADSAVEAAARAAGIHEFIAALPSGYATQVGEGGAELSTGQRQRIAIARALLAAPLVVVLDEATSGLDAPTARSVQEAVDAAFAHRTRIVITHRAGDVEQADLRLELVDGRLVPAGQA